MIRAAILSSSLNNHNDDDNLSLKSMPLKVYHYIMVGIIPFIWQRAICVNDLSESDAKHNNKKPDGFLKVQRVICLLFL